MYSVEELLEAVPQIEERIGVVFREKKILALAFIHRSFVNEMRDEEELGHNERLEFLGDSVLGLILSGHLYRALPEESEGHLSHLRAHLVGAESCSQYLHSLKLEEFLLLGKGEMGNVGRGRERILADLFEAIMGAIYLDQGIASTETFFLAHFGEVIDQVVKEPLRNWKADFQDYSQKRTQKPPEYRVLSEEGPAHDRKFVVAAYLEDEEVGRGEGPSKKQAEQNAAEDSLRSIEKEEEVDGEG